jgi:hypothetical protein
MIVIADESKLVETLGTVSSAHRSRAVRHGRRPGIAVERLASRLGLTGAIQQRVDKDGPISPMGIISSSTHLLAAFRMQKRSQTGSLQFPAWSSTDCFSIWQAPLSSLLQAARGPCLQQTLNRSETEHDYSHRSQAFRRRVDRGLKS